MASHTQQRSGVRAISHIWIWYPSDHIVVPSLVHGTDSAKAELGKARLLLPFVPSTLVAPIFRQSTPPNGQLDYYLDGFAHHVSFKQE